MFHADNYELRAYRRRLPTSSPVLRIRYTASTDQRYYWKPFNLRVLLLLNGTCMQQEGQRWWRVEAPAVLIQRPGLGIICDSDGPREELLLGYPPPIWAQWSQAGLRRPAEPAHQVRDPDVFHAVMADLASRLAKLEQPLQIDAVDRLCEMLVFCAANPVPASDLPPQPDALAALHEYLQHHACGPVDIESLALQYDMSPSTLRRRWHQRYGLSPMKFVLQQRMTEACRLLIETNEPIARIARQVGYDDPFYFSRAFRRHVGIAPSEHRTQG